MDYPKPLLDNLNRTCRRLPACQQQPGAARKQHSRGPEPQRDALTRPISQERAARKLCLFRRCGGQLRPVGLSQLSWSAAAILRKSSLKSVRRKLSSGSHWCRW